MQQSDSSLSNHNTDASTLWQSLRWLPIHYRIQLTLITHTHKALHSAAPHYISSLIQPNGTLCSANNLRLNILNPTLALLPPRLLVLHQFSGMCYLEQPNLISKSTVSVCPKNYFFYASLSHSLIWLLFFYVSSMLLH